MGVGLTIGIFVINLLNLCGKCVTEDVDPCSVNMELPNADKRYIYYIVDPAQEEPIHDGDLENGWYKASAPMSTEQPKQFYSCGTRFPIWMNGQQPDIDDGIVDRTACTITAASLCSTAYNIQVKNCTTFFVYNLTKTNTNDEGYCFGVGMESNKTDFVPAKPKGIAYEVLRAGVFDDYTEAQIKCDFSPSTTYPDLFYQVQFYLDTDSNDLTEYFTPTVQQENFAALEITEEKYYQELNLRLGINIKCRVRAFTVEMGIPGDFSELSDAFFAGLEVRVDDPQLERGEVGTISVRPTVPIGCQVKTGCVIALYPFVPADLQCTGVAFDDTCSYSLPSKNWHDQTWFPIKVQAAVSTQYQLQGVFDIYLKTENTLENKIWNGYILPKQQVEIVDVVGNWKGKLCYSYNDPHMKTFDGRRYENHIRGDYILYRHTLYDAEVQVRVEECSTNIMCNSGVAVKAGDDVFAVDRSNPYMPFIGYKENHCADQTLDVRKVNPSKYLIYLPYGTYVTVTLSYRHFINVAITSSVYDQHGVTGGLCGALNGDNCLDDFRLRNHSLIAASSGPCSSYARIHPTGFTQEWRVRDSENLFEFTKAVEEGLTPWGSYVCVCDGENAGNDKTPCGGRTVRVCRKGQTVGVKSCVIRTRRKRSVGDSLRLPRRNFKIETFWGEKRSERTTNMTDEEATTYCDNYFNESPVRTLCGQQVPNSNGEATLENCVLDINITGTVEWSESAREAMQDQCLNELQRNTTLRETEGDQPSIAEAIEEKACPGLCQNRGTCVNGTCICPPDFGSSDCSLDLTTPPEVFGFLDNGLCDEQYLDCSEAIIFGQTFVESENLMCNVSAFEISLDGHRTYTGHIVQFKGLHETLYEMACPVEQTSVRKKRSIDVNSERTPFVLGYRISVSNDGKQYGEENDLYMYDSACQVPSNTTDVFVFTLAENFCFIANECVADGLSETNTSCYVCNATENSFDWTLDTSSPGCFSDNSTANMTTNTSTETTTTSMGTETTVTSTGSSISSTMENLSTETTTSMETETNATATGTSMSSTMENFSTQTTTTMEAETTVTSTGTYMSSTMENLSTETTSSMETETTVTSTGTSMSSTMENLSTETTTSMETETNATATGTSISSTMENFSTETTTSMESETNITASTMENPNEETSSPGSDSRRSSASSFFGTKTLHFLVFALFLMF